MAAIIECNSANCTAGELPDDQAYCHNESCDCICHDEAFAVAYNALSRALDDFRSLSKETSAKAARMKAAGAYQKVRAALDRVAELKGQEMMAKATPRYVILPNLPLDVYEMPDPDTHSLIAECPNIAQAKRVLTMLNQAAAVEALVEAAESFAEKGVDLSRAFCHNGLCTPEQCARCKRVIKLRAAVEALKGEV